MLSFQEINRYYRSYKFKSFCCHHGYFNSIAYVSDVRTSM